MTIKTAIKKVNDFCIYFIYGEEEEPYFQYDSKKKKVKFNHYKSSYGAAKQYYTPLEFIKAVEEVEKIDILSSGRLKTKTYTYQILKSINKNAKAFEYSSSAKSISAKYSSIKISLINNPLVLSLAIIKKQLSGRMDPMDEYHVVIEIKKPRNRKTDIDDHLINQFLFDLDTKHELQFNLGSFNKFFSIDYDELPKKKNIDHVKLVSNKLNNSKLNLINPDVIKLYRQAQEILDEELKLIHLYKIFEYFGPIIIKLKTYDELKRILEPVKAAKPDAKYLERIIKTANKYETSKKDNLLIKETFSECIKIKPIVSFLPRSFNRNIKNKSLRIDLKKRIANKLYSTRNSIVHAKANYTLKGNEITKEEIPQFNIFLNHAAIQIINWYKELPKHRK